MVYPYFNATSQYLKRKAPKAERLRLSDGVGERFAFEGLSRSLTCTTSNDVTRVTIALIDNAVKQLFPYAQTPIHRACQTSSKIWPFFDATSRLICVSTDLCLANHLEPLRSRLAH